MNQTAINHKRPRVRPATGRPNYKMLITINLTSKQPQTPPGGADMSAPGSAPASASPVVSLDAAALRYGPRQPCSSSLPAGPAYHTQPPMEPEGIEPSSRDSRTAASTRVSDACFSTPLSPSAARAASSVSVVWPRQAEAPCRDGPAELMSVDSYGRSSTLKTALFRQP